MDHDANQRRNTNPKALNQLVPVSNGGIPRAMLSELSTGKEQRISYDEQERSGKFGHERYQHGYLRKTATLQTHFPKRAK